MNASPAPLKPWQMALTLWLTLVAIGGLKIDALLRYVQTAYHQTWVTGDDMPATLWRDWMQHSHTQWREVSAEADRRLVAAANVLVHGLRSTAVAGAADYLPPGRTTAAPAGSGRPDPRQQARLDAQGRFVLTPQDRVLFVGDSMMQGVAPHVVRALKRDYGIESFDASRQSTGLAYPSFYDWPQAVRELLPQHKATTVVVMLGANDTWDMILDHRFERFGSERWQKEYAARIDNILDFAHANQARVVWLGAPNMGRPKLAAGVPILNQLYASEAQKRAPFARYVPTLSALADSSATFNKYKTLPGRGEVAMRTDDGIHFTPAGQKALAELVLQQFALPALRKDPS